MFVSIILLRAYQIHECASEVNKMVLRTAKENQIHIEVDLSINRKSSYEYLRIKILYE